MLHYGGVRKHLSTEEDLKECSLLQNTGARNLRSGTTRIPERTTPWSNLNANALHEQAPLILSPGLLTTASAAHGNAVSIGFRRNK